MTLGALATFALGAIAALAVLTLILARLIAIGWAIFLGWIFQRY